MRAAFLLAIVMAAMPAPAQESLEVTGNLRGMTREYLTSIARRLWTDRAEKVAALRTPEQVRQRQEYVRSTFIRLLGGFPPKTPLNARITGSFTRDGYRVEKLIYESRPRFYVTANVYVPATGHAPYPAVLGAAGHTDTGKAAAIYQHGWIGLAKRGFLVLAFDPPGQGERVQFYDPETGRSRTGSATGEHTSIGLQCLLTGSNLAQYMVWDGIRGLDYLLTRADVDPKRIAVAGNSGGGTQSAYLAMTEPRLAAAAPSCYLTSSEKLWTDLTPQDAEQNLAGFLSAGLDLKDFALAFAPRPFQFLTAIRDFFPIAGARDAYAEARHIYEVMDQPQRVNFFEYDDGHGWSQPRREETYRWFERWLNGRPDNSGEEPPIEVEPASALNATATGQVVTAFQAETVQSLNAALAERLASARPSRSAREIPRVIAARTGAPLARDASVPAVQNYGDVGRDGYRIRKITLATEPGMTIPALVLIPEGGAARKPAVLYVNARGKAADASRGGDMEALARSGYVVLAPDLRGWGETGTIGRPPHSELYEISMRAMLIGKTLPGMQTLDLLRSFDYLASRPDVDASRIALLSKGNATAAGLFAAALEPRIRAVACEGAPISYLDLARARLHGEVADLIVPGVLQDFDLPDAARAIAPRALWIVDPRTPAGALAPLSQASSEYGAAARVLERPEGWSFEKVYGAWLAALGQAPSGGSRAARLLE